MKIKLYQDDLPSNLNLGLTIAIDTETMGLNFTRDKLCLVQVSCGDNNALLWSLFCMGFLL